MGKWCCWRTTAVSTTQVIANFKIFYLAPLDSNAVNLFHCHFELFFSSFLCFVPDLIIAGLAKILKKYDKRSGRFLRLLFIEKILKQPFFTTDLISKLVKECESIIDLVFPSEAGHRQLKQEEKRKLVGEEQSIFRSTVVALMTMQEMRKGSSTYGQFSLPPLSLPDVDLLHSLQPPPIPIPGVAMCPLSTLQVQLLRHRCSFSSEIISAADASSLFPAIISSCSVLARLL